MLAALLLATAMLIAAVQSGTAPKTAAPTPKPAARSASPASAEFNKAAKDAAAARDAGRIDEAIALLRIRMIPSELPPDRRELVMLAGRGAYYRAARKPAAAKPAFELLVQRYPDAPNVHYAYGVYLLGEDPDRGVEEFKQELKI